MKNLLLFISFLFCLSAFSQDAEKIEWLTIEEAYAKMQKEPKKTFIDVYTGWCGWCKRLDATTFKDPEIIKYINENYYAVKLDAEMKDTLRIGTQVFINENPEGRRSAHQAAIALLQGKMGYPSMVFLDEGFNMIQPISGYMTPEQLTPVLKYYGEDHHKTTPWEEYSKQNP